jgi:heme exporter protein D
MMPDLGKYADTVLSAYAASIALLVAIVVLTLVRGRRVRAEMAKIEAKARRDG